MNIMLKPVQPEEVQLMASRLAILCDGPTPMEKHDAMQSVGKKAIFVW